MNTNLKRMLPIFAVAAMTATTAVFAYDNDMQKEKTTHAVPPPVNAHGEDALSFFVGAAYTYWVPYEGGTNVAIAEGANDSEALTTSTPGTVVSPAFNGVSGFKVGLGANTHHDGWVVALNYTWFYHAPGMKDSGVALTQTGSSGTFNSAWSNDDISYNTIASQFHMQFNRIDACLDRAFYAGHYLAFRPWIGLLGAWDSQALNSNGTFAASSISPLTTATSDQIRMNQSWWGIGPYAGVDCTYYFANEFGLFLSSGVAMMLNNYNVNERQDYYLATTNLGTNYNIATEFNNVAPMLEGTLGLRWDSFWTEWALRLELGWELQTYFAHNGYTGVVAPQGVRGQYSMQGLTAVARVNF